MTTAADYTKTLRARWAPPRPTTEQFLHGWGVRTAANAGVYLDNFFGSRAKRQFGILMYHRIAHRTPGVAEPTINVTPPQFRRQISGLLKRGFEFWPLRDVLQRQRDNQEVPDNVVVVTFDDGFESVYTQAYPVLREFNVPATVFINTAYLGSDQPLPFDHWGLANRALAPAESYRAMTWDQAHHLRDSDLVELGAHTHTHEDFRHRPDEFQRDLVLCVDVLRNDLGVENPTFAFPYGTPRLGFASDELVDAARGTGVQCGLTTQPELVELGQDPFFWGRFNAFPWDDGGTLAAKLRGWYSWAPRQRQMASRVFHGVFGPRNTRLDVEANADMTTAPQHDLTDPPTYPSTDEPVDSVSVIIPTFNRANWIAGALQTMQRQQTGGLFSLDIYVIDNNSSDDTETIVRDLAKDSPVPIHYLKQEKPGDAPTRNLGVATSTSNWLAFFDDDQLAEPDWVKQLYAAAHQTKAPVVGGPVFLDLPKDELARIGKICRKSLREISFYSHLHPYEKKTLPGTGNALVHRGVFDEVGMFDESMTSGGSDSDFFIRSREAGFDLWYTPLAVIRHRIAQQRLSKAYMRWDALSGGAGHAAYFDLQKKGRLALAWICVLRIVHALIVTAPLLWFAYLRRNAGDVLGRKTQFWRTEGYARKTLSVLCPQWFAQREFFDSLEFRKGREIGLDEEVECS
ncbi:MAG: polysaccharide deacetylase family protein [Pirellulaceae bacterium]|nr:polysaccharide deacetylase family protein [Pirellulaceae bacterium]